MPAHLQTLLYYSAVILLVVGIILGVTVGVRTRREAREGVDLVDEADMLSEFQRARDSGEMDDAEFRRVRDLLIDGKRPRGAEQPKDIPNPESQATPSAPPPPETPPPTDPA